MATYKWPWQHVSDVIYSKSARICLCGKRLIKWGKYQGKPSPPRGGTIHLPWESKQLVSKHRYPACPVDGNGEPAEGLHRCQGEWGRAYCPATVCKQRKYAYSYCHSRQMRCKCGEVWRSVSLGFRVVS